MFEIFYADEVIDDLRQLSARDRATIIDRIKQQLRDQPLQRTRAKKLISGLKLPWATGRPIWQLRVTEFRIYYDVDEDRKHVTVHGIRKKPPHATTEQIL